ncbi:dihydrofolate reductase [Polyrhizophydium stewartii]|uniref:Dihydrofolate reductase n=1 Tax=Polyrhizophydium stewartii TaxID=2732419 RepID=A0ABR4N7E6_9FUNG
MRLFSRAHEKRILFKLICHNPRVHNPCRTRKWRLSRRVRQQRRNYHAVGQPDLPVSSRDDLRKFVLARTLATSSRNDSTDRYAAAGFIHTAGFVHDPMSDQPRSRGVCLVAALRMNSLWTDCAALRIAGLLVNHPFAADRCILRVFRKRTAVLRKDLAKTCELVYVTAPHALEQDAAEAAGAGEDDEGPRAWWRATSRDSTVYEGLDEAMGQLEGVWDSAGPFAGVFGFSQGGDSGT